MKTWGWCIAVGLVAWAVGGPLQGCVSSSTYELAKRDAEKAMLLYQNEQNRAQALASANKQLQLQVETMQVALKEAQEKLARADREFKETRDELLKIKIEQEQLAKSRGRRGQLFPRSEAEQPLAAVPEGQTKPQADPEDTKRRLRELMQHLQTMLNQF